MIELQVGLTVEPELDRPVDHLQDVLLQQQGPLAAQALPIR
jgi:hypothetical protein